jgi:hypothetical protein
MELKSPDTPAKFTMSVSVTVRPEDVNVWPISRSSKYKCCAVNMLYPAYSLTSILNTAIQKSEAVRQARFPLPLEKSHDQHS